jgi:hypothetical protein
MARRAALTLTCLLVASSACTASAETSGSDRPAPRPGPAPERARVERTTPAEALEAYRSKTRLRPDGRFLRAFSDVHAIATGRAAQPVEATFDGAGWQLRQGALQVASFPTLPSFSAQFEPLVEWARTSLAAPIGKQTPPGKPGSAPGGRTLRRPISELLKAEQRWLATRDPGSALQAANQLTRLYLEGGKSNELADDVAGRGLAALAIARALDGSSGKSQEALLASSMGYQGHAVAIANGLGAEDPVAAYVLNRNELLLELAAHGELAQYLWLKRSMTLLRPALWLAELQKRERSSIDAAVRVLELVQSVGGPGSTLAPRVLAQLTSYWLDVPVPPDADASWAFGRAGDVEQAIERVSQGQKAGPFLDPALLRAAEESVYVEAVSHCLAKSPAESRALLRVQPLGAIAGIRRWYDFKDRWHARIYVEDERRQLLQPGQVPGATYRSDLLGDHNWTPPLLSDLKLVRANTLAWLATLDSRPFHRRLAEPRIEHQLRDPALAAELEESLVRDEDNDSARVKVHLRRGELDAAMAVLVGELGAWRPMTRVVARHPRVDLVRLSAIFRDLWTHPEIHDALYEPYYELLWDRVEDFAAAEKLARSRLVDLPEQAEKERAAVSGDVAYALRRQGRLAEARAAVEPYFDSGNADLLRQAIWIALAQRDFDAADSLAARARKAGLDDASYRVARAGALWGRRRNDEAARALVGQNRLAAAEFAEYVPPRFWYAFEGAPDAEILDAFDALLRVDRRAHLAGGRAIADEFAERGQPDLAFEMSLRLARLNLRPADGEPEYVAPERMLYSEYWRAQHVGRAWQFLREWRGEDAARAWLRELRSRPIAYTMAPNFFTVGALELLWEAYPGDSLPSYVLLLRAHAVALDPELAARHGAGVRAMLEKTRQGEDNSLARIALGLVPESEVLEQRMTHKRLCETATYLAVAAQTRGDLRRASDWYQVAVGTGLLKFNTYVYSLQQLEAWRETDQAFVQSGSIPASPLR